MYHIFFIHFSVDGHLGCFHVLTIVNSAAVSIGVHVSFCLFLIGVQLLYDIVLASVVQRSESATWTHLARPLASLSHPSTWLPSTELSSLCHTAASHQLSIRHTVVQLCQSSLSNSFHAPFPPCAHMSVLYVWVSIPALEIGSSVPLF